MSVASTNTAASAKTHRQFSITHFILLVALQAMVVFFAIQIALPGFWGRQIAAGPLAIMAVFVSSHLLLAFFEWFFHRYVLHFVTTSLMRKFAQDHRQHHRLTAIYLRPVPGASHRVILNEYPIKMQKQFESSSFPFYALSAFWVFFTPLLVVLQWVWPTVPVILGGYAAIAWSMMLYEILHAINHRPYEWWQKAVEHRQFGAFWKLIYGFHLMHHANVGCNEAISGFFSLPVPDWCFGTYHQPKQLLLEGRKATAKDFSISPPSRFVSRLDRWARARETRLQHRAFAANPGSVGAAKMEERERETALGNIGG